MELPLIRVLLWVDVIWAPTPLALSYRPPPPTTTAAEMISTVLSLLSFLPLLPLKFVVDISLIVCKYYVVMEGGGGGGGDGDS